MPISDFDKLTTEQERQAILKAHRMSESGGGLTTTQETSLNSLVNSGLDQAKMTDLVNMPSASEVDAGIAKVNSIQNVNDVIVGLNSTPEEIDDVINKYLTNSKNLFNIDSMILGKYMSNASSTPSDNAIYNISDFIEVKVGEPYVCNKRLRFVTYLDINYSNVGGVAGDVSIGTVLTPPTDSKYMVVTLYASDDLSDTQIEQNTEITAYAPFGSDYPTNIKNLLAGILPDSSVNLETLNFIEVGKNKFNKNTCTDGSYMGVTGNTSVSASYCYSDFIEVDENETYFTNGFLRFVTYYNSEKIAVESVGLGDVYEETLDNESFVIPSGVFYMVVSVYISDKDTLQIEKGSVLTEYDEYCYVYKDIPIKTQTLTENVGIATITPTQYLCENKEVDFYNENVLRDKKYLGQCDIDIGITDTRWRNNSVSAKITDLSSLTGNSYDGTLTVANEDYQTVAEKEFNVKIVDMSKNTAATIANIGDSFSGRMTWVNNILGETIPAQNLNFVGVRNANTAPIKCDAQGGYTISSWFTLDSNDNLNQFMHPINNYLYYGLTSFWIDANSVSPSYGGGWFNDAKVLFDAVTGIKLTPNINDVMNQGTKEVPDYIVWNGTSWVTIDEATLGGFSWSFAKYRQAWDIPNVDILHVLLGTNDFSGATVNNFDDKYATFKSYYDELIDSVHADLPNCKIVIGIPVSRGKQGKYGTISTERGKLAMWMCANALNTDYANKEGENIYLLDYHTQVDRVYGYDNTQETPFAEYDGTLSDDENVYKTDYIHLGQDGFDQMGNAYMAIIQELR